MTEHKHAEVLRAIADGREVQCKRNGEWLDYLSNSNSGFTPLTHPCLEWRIKPEPRTPRRIWLPQYEGTGVDGYATEEQCERACSCSRFICAREFIEVLPDE